MKLLLFQHRITEDLEEQSSVKDVVLSHYVTLVEVFKHYASVGSAVSTGEIDIMEARGEDKLFTRKILSRMNVDHHDTHHRTRAIKSPESPIRRSASLACSSIGYAEAKSCDQAQKTHKIYTKPRGWCYHVNTCNKLGEIR